MDYATFSVSLHVIESLLKPQFFLKRSNLDLNWLSFHLLNFQNSRKKVFSICFVGVHQPFDCNATRVCWTASRIVCEMSGGMAGEKVSHENFLRVFLLSSPVRPLNTWLISSPSAFLISGLYCQHPHKQFFLVVAVWLSPGTDLQWWTFKLISCQSHSWVWVWRIDRQPSCKLEILLASGVRPVNVRWEFVTFLHEEAKDGSELAVSPISFANKISQPKLSWESPKREFALVGGGGGGLQLSGEEVPIS